MIASRPRTAIDTLRTFRSSAWLGWQIDSNWTTPLMFMLYSIAKPLAGIMIILVMYKVVAGPNLAASAFPNFFIGTTFYLYVPQILIGLGTILVEDREHYEVLKYLYVSPTSLLVYLLGRGLAKFFLATFMVIVTLAFGVLAFGLDYHLENARYTLLAVSFFFGQLGVLGVGLILAGVSLIAVRHESQLGEPVAGVLYLVTGAVFPVHILPAWLQSIALVLPFPFWIELTRRSFHHGGADRLFTGFTDAEMVVRLAESSVVLLVFGFAVYHVCERLARSQGLLDRTSGH